MNQLTNSPTNSSDSSHVQGTHFCVDMRGCNTELLNDEARLREILLSAAEQASATVLGVQSHAFTPYGVTIVLLLAESHMSIHTWPERQFAAVDVFTCGRTMSSQHAIDYIMEQIGATSSRSTMLERGE
jgi:S-adenosylmethionine decarboxylase